MKDKGKQGLKDRWTRREEHGKSTRFCLPYHTSAMLFPKAVGGEHTPGRVRKGL